MATRDEQKAIVKKFIDNYYPPKLPSAKEFQEQTTGDREAKGPAWVSRVKFPAPSDSSVLGDFLEAVARLGSGQEAFALPHLAGVSGEWIGFRSQATNSRCPEPLISEREKYDCLTKEAKNDLTIFYIHGGAYATGSPTNTRIQAGKLCQLTGGRCFSLRYRLAPQIPAPAQQLDAFVAYLYLLYPPVGAEHQPVPAESIVLAGESCGSAICLSIVLIILQLRRQQSTTTPRIRFNGRDVVVPLPAGVTSLCLSGDVPNSLPSYHHARNKANDFMQDVPPHRDAHGPADDIWPTVPPRPEAMCETSAMAHPLLSPSIARDWTGAPPLWLACGEERMADCSRLLVQTAAAQGVAAQLIEYELMPHIFATMLRGIPQSAHCMQAWAEACLRFCKGEKVQARATFVEAGELRERRLDVARLVEYSLDQAIAMVVAKQNATPVWTGPSSKI